MSTLYGHAVRDATISTDTTVSTAINIAGAKKILFEIPTAAVGLSTTTCNIYAQVCNSTDGTFRRIKVQGVYSAGSGILDWETPSSLGNFFVEVPIAGWNFVKAESNNTASTNFNIKVHMSNLF